MGQPLRALTVVGLVLLAGCASEKRMEADAPAQAERADEGALDGPKRPPRAPAPDGQGGAGPWANDPWTDRPTTTGGPEQPARPVRVDLASVTALERRQWPLVPADVRLGAAWVTDGLLADDGPALLDLEARLAREARVTAVLALRPGDAPDGVIARTAELCAWAKAQRLDLLLVGSRDARGDVVLLLHVAAAAPLEVWVGGPPTGEVNDDLAARLASAGLATLTRR